MYYIREIFRPLSAAMFTAVPDKEELRIKYRTKVAALSAIKNLGTQEEHEYIVTYIS